MNRLMQRARYDWQLRSRRLALGEAHAADGDHQPYAR